MQKSKMLFQKKNKSRIKRDKEKALYTMGAARNFIYKKKKSVSSHITSNAITGSKHDVTGVLGDGRSGMYRNRSGAKYPVRSRTCCRAGRSDEPFIDTHDIGYMALSWRYKNIGCGLCVLTFPFQPVSRASPRCGQFIISRSRVRASRPLLNIGNARSRLGLRQATKIGDKDALRVGV